MHSLKPKQLEFEEKTRNTNTIVSGINLENVSFRYEESKEWLYQDVSIEIPVAKSVAFIGTTGAGKTTLADIILGIHQPSKGKVTVDGKDIFDSKYKRWWAGCIGYIPQTIYLCDYTVRKNVAFGVEESKIDDERVWACLKEASLNTFVEELPDGLNTITGENGLRLSGGQRQRIGIARALYHDPPFLVMDEATSSLDNDTEAAIIETINGMSGKKTMLIIAHRLTTIKGCDYVYRIDNHKVELVDYND